MASDTRGEVIIIENPTFEDWMFAVDNELMSIVLLSSSDLPDIDYYGRFEAGATAEQVAGEALLYAGFGED